MAKDKAEMMRELRKKRKKLGLIPVTVWVKPEHKRKVLAYAEIRLNNNNEQDEKT